MKPKQVMIPEDLFLAIYKYHVLEQKDPALAEKIRAGVDAKGDAIYRRILYTEYYETLLSLGTGEALVSVLDEKGVPEEYRW